MLQAKQAAAPSTWSCRARCSGGRTLVLGKRKSGQKDKKIKKGNWNIWNHVPSNSSNFFVSNIFRKKLPFPTQCQCQDSILRGVEILHPPGLWSWPLAWLANCRGATAEALTNDAWCRRALDKVRPTVSDCCCMRRGEGEEKKNEISWNL